MYIYVSCFTPVMYIETTKGRRMTNAPSAKIDTQKVVGNIKICDTFKIRTN